MPHAVPDLSALPPAAPAAPCARARGGDVAAVAPAGRAGSPAR
ncbi:hypothetical protein SAMN05216258_107128 [Albimonas pacifica]|uniref:Uncharacterized protein n=1 Tax=Albimonas pacifica TaxID=1114924 RepID=A0A1I3IMA1_9RHOB|nr:hypothetical protein SAMN05216258_107128 [Albimonas pacifica]